MVTLTVDRQRFESARSAFDYVKRNRVISRAISSWAEVKGVEVRGWLSKLELHKDGWPHWHVIVEVGGCHSLTLGIERQRREEFATFWQLGYSHVSWVKSAGYVTKYACKPSADGYQALECSGLPAYGVRVITVSRNFWAGVDAKIGQTEMEYDDDAESVDGGVDDGWGVIAESDDICDQIVRDAKAEHIVRVEACGGAVRLSVFSPCFDRVVGSVKLHHVAFPEMMLAIVEATGLMWEDGDVVLNSMEWEQALLAVGVTADSESAELILGLLRNSTDHSPFELPLDYEFERYKYGYNASGYDVPS